MAMVLSERSAHTAHNTPFIGWRACLLRTCSAHVRWMCGCAEVDGAGTVSLPGAMDPTPAQVRAYAREGAAWCAWWRSQRLCPSGAAGAAWRDPAPRRGRTGIKPAVPGLRAHAGKVCRWAFLALPMLGQGRVLQRGAGCGRGTSGAKSADSAPLAHRWWPLARDPMSGGEGQRPDPWRPSRAFERDPGRTGVWRGKARKSLAPAPAGTPPKRARLHRSG